MSEQEPTGERLHKVLAQAGFGSRREIERWIVAGRIVVNDVRAQTGARVTSRDRISVDGKPVHLASKTPRVRVLALNKPEGVICTASDPGGRPTAESLLPRKDGIRWISVGRLDINTSGLLLFTNDGGLANQLMHPKYEIDREYAVRIFGEVDGGTLNRLKTGIDIDGEMFAFEDVVRGNGRGANRWYYCVVRQGRHREVRRIWESQGLQVSRLIRARFGNVMLPRDLKSGEHFEVKGVMLDDLFRLARFQARRAQ